MTSEYRIDPIAKLRASWADQGAGGGSADYELLSGVAGSFGALSRSGLPTLVVPIARIDPWAVGRHAAGCELIPHVSVRFRAGGREWDGPAAALCCTDPELVDSFAVLAADVASTVGERPTWNAVLAAVEEWQRLLSSRSLPTAEAEAGLWGELWFLTQGLDVDRLVAGWRGPEHSWCDFFLDGMSAELKTTRTRGHHHVSLSQMVPQDGPFEGWLLSVWIQADPAARETVGTLVSRLLARAQNPAEVLRRLGHAGYSPSDRSSYRSGFVILGEPEWYAVEDVPQVRQADAGVSQLRYQIVLDSTRRADRDTADRLWRHFLGHAYGSEV